MKFREHSIYHVYNQGNNKEVIFKKDEDYLHFLKKIRSLVLPNCKILAYCLMPNHFHFMLLATEASIVPLSLGNIQTNKLSNAFRLLLSEYAQDFNERNNRSGSLFRQKTKAKEITELGSPEYLTACFNYIHHNPADAGLVRNLMDWDYSSLRDFLQLREGTLCDRQLALELLGIDLDYIKETLLAFKPQADIVKQIE